MASIESIWDEDLVFLRDQADKDEVVLDDELEEEFGLEVWTLWNQGLDKEQARQVAYSRVIKGELEELF